MDGNEILSDEDLDDLLEEEYLFSEMLLLSAVQSAIIQYSMDNLSFCQCAPHY